MTSRQWGFKLFGLGVYMLANSLGAASTYDCILREQLGTKALVSLAIALAWVGGFICFHLGASHD